ncbi:hypothetical protein GCM10007385_21280 [Tateyamaria omphalii]|uniref:hypothetical protein n=1 Tax=Tateyamaria omphalii TaxID=299262 RepID=UPI0016770AC2|nr:hypothetical protein [Tateyamaria omphalii]GGX52983.1 hypothetical protein GCM10007385_21280 [Tateyamaria omphalii]
MQGLDFKEGEVIATIAASPGRRILGIGSLWVLSLLVIYVGVVRPPEIGWQLFLFALGGGSIWIAEKMRRATALTLELTPEVLRDSSGAMVALTADIQSLDRGMFAFKPSNGFLLRLNTAGGRAWRPGLWWRLGNRVGVGGMTPGHQAKFMAEILSAMIAERSSD